MVIRKIIFIFLMSSYLVGCTGDTNFIHSPSYSDIKSEIGDLDKEYKKSKSIMESQKDNILPTIIQFGVIDGFYVNTDTVDKRKKIILPEEFDEKIQIKTAGSMSEIITELSDFIFFATGVNVIIETSTEELEMPVEDKSNSVPVGQSLSQVMADTTTGTSEGKTLKQAFGVSTPQSQSTVLQPRPAHEVDFEFNGTITELINRIATLKKSKWRYDQINKDITLYNLITKTFILPIPPSSSSSSISVSSAASASGDATSGSTSASLSSSSKSNPWKSVEKALTTMVSKKGTIILNKETGFVEITDTYKKMPSIESYIDSIIELYSSQLLVDVRVVHLANKINNTKEINWTTINTRIGQVVASSTFGNPANISAASSLLLGYKADPNAEQNNISAAIDLLSTFAESYSVDSFSAITTNFTPVPIQIASETVYFNKTISNASADSAANVEVSFESITKQLGTTITLTPSIISDFINLSYVFQKTHQTAVVEDPSGSQYPLTATKTFVQNVKLKNGVPMVISAINSEESTNNSSSPLATGAWFLGGSEQSNESSTKDIVLVTVSKLRQNLTDYKKNYYDEDIISTSDYLSR